MVGISNKIVAQVISAGEQGDGIGFAVDNKSGTKGLSVFAVPKRSINADGTPGGPNAVNVSRIEPKWALKHRPPAC